MSRAWLVALYLQSEAVNSPHCFRDSSRQGRKLGKETFTLPRVISHGSCLQVMRVDSGVLLYTSVCVCHHCAAPLPYRARLHQDHCCAAEIKDWRIRCGIHSVSQTEKSW